MKKTLLTVTTIASIALSGCATQSINSFESFQARDLTPLLRSNHLQQKKNTFFVINDSSSSTGETFVGSGFSGLSKLSVEKELLSRMNQTIPNIALSSGLRSFGFGPCLSWGFSKLNQPLQSHSSSSFDNAINSLECSSGGTPVGSAITAAAEDLSSATGNIAVILLSDGQFDMHPAPAVEALKERYGNSLCLYTVWVGNEDQQSGQAVLQNLADISRCGFATTASSIASNDGMAAFVTKVFFTAHTPFTPVAQEGDADGDGVLDSKDKCPNTPRGAIVDRDGCWAFHGILFDFDQATIRSGYESQFNNAIKVLQLNPGLTVEIQGHTDSRGPEVYNQNLSERRAQTVKQHLVDNGIAASRLTTRGFGESHPVASNDTKEGRAHNRRVFYKRTDM